MMSSSSSSHFGFQSTHISPSTQARVGVFHTLHATLKTPCFLLYTKEGSPPHLTPDLLDTLNEVNAVQLMLQDLIDKKDVFEAFRKQKNGGAHQFFALGERVVYVGIRDPILFTEGLSAPSYSLDKTENREKKETLTEKEGFITTVNKKGRAKITLEDYAKIVTSLEPDIFSAMSSEVQFHSSQKRSLKALQVSISLLDSLLPLLPPHLQRAIFGHISCTSNAMHRKNSVLEISKREVGGFVLSGIDTGETLEERNEALKEIISNLPIEKPRLITGPGSPEDILNFIENGIDIFSTYYPHLMTEWGFALIFPLSLPFTQQKCITQASYTENNNNNNSNPFYYEAKKKSIVSLPQSEFMDASKLNLHDPFFMLDSTPILPSCQCFTCVHHTKAYIHHLLNTHEMLASVLLTIHNVHHYSLFFKSIRDAIENGHFTQYKEEFTKWRNCA